MSHNAAYSGKRDPVNCPANQPDPRNVCRAKPQLLNEDGLCERCGLPPAEQPQSSTSYASHEDITRATKSLFAKDRVQPPATDTASHELRSASDRKEWTPWFEAIGSYIPQSVCDKHEAELAAAIKPYNDGWMDQAARDSIEIVRLENSIEELRNTLERIARLLPEEGANIAAKALAKVKEKQSQPEKEGREKVIEKQ